MMSRILSAALFVGVLAVTSFSSVAQPPREKGPGKEGRGGPPKFELGRVFPPPLVDELKLTPEQVQELDAIEKDLKAKLSRLLTKDQKKVAENFRPGPPMGDRPDGPPKGDRPDGPPKGDRPPSEPRGEKKPPEPMSNAQSPNAQAPNAGIQWFATLASAKTEAERTGRPMLLISGTPHCAGVSGMW